MRKFKVSPDEAGMRADVFLAKKYPDFSRSSLKSLFNSQLVTKNKVAISAGDKLKLDDEINVDEDLLNTQPTQVSIPIIYEDRDVVVMDKPAGMLTHSKGVVNFEPTVAGFLTSKITDKGLVGNRAGIVHRLDRGTSGVIIGARNSEALKSLQKQFSERRVKKIYYALVEGKPNQKKAIIDAPIERDPKHPQTFRVGQEGKSAKTKYEIVKVTERNGAEFTLLKLEPLTGRTHQIRVHLKYIGAPIIGDNIYGHASDQPIKLRATSLELNLPDGNHKTFKVPLPKSFLSL